MRLHEIPFLFNNQMSAHNCYPGFSLCRFVLNVGFILYSYTRGVIRGACRCILFSARCFRYTSECVWQLLNIPRGWRERLKGAVSHRVISLGFLGFFGGHFGLIWLANICVRSALASKTKQKKENRQTNGPNACRCYQMRVCFRQMIIAARSARAVRLLLLLQTFIFKDPSVKF